MKRARDQNDGDGERSSLNCSLASTGTTTTTTSNEVLSKQTQTNDDADQGHRYGNFHNYYTFHPVSNRTAHIEDILTYIANQWTEYSTLPHHKQDTFRYVDIGCNEGDLTLEISKLLSNEISNAALSSRPNTTGNGAVSLKQKHQNTKVLCTGLDLDSNLIRRAQIKVQEDVGLQPSIEAQFKVLDVLQQDIDLQQQGGESITESDTPPIKYSVDLTTLFSTTMWIHIHGGDDGLRQVLQKICSLTQYWILLEPQPSKCYGRAAFRLRRLGLPPIDVSNDRLRLRPNIEEAIETILNECQFERVKFCNLNSYNKIDVVSSAGHTSQEEESGETKTLWNRSLRLYQRFNISSHALTM